MNYYLVGIKGSGMAGLAQILCDLGHNVKGCDVKEHIFIEEKLIEKNILIETFENMHYEDSDIIIIGNAFLNKYTFENKKTITYQEMLSNLNDIYFSIAVCGTHGKTTTTNMIKHVLSNFYKTSYLVGDGQGKAEINGKYFVYEACEHRDHFLNYHPNVIVCTNIDYDHVEYFNNKKQYKQSFISFFKQCKDNLILHDSINCKKNNVIRYGINNSSLKAFNVEYTEKGINFDLLCDGVVYKKLYLPFYGKHMLMNSLACIACCYTLNIDILSIINELKKYKEAGRRYNITFVNSNVIIDDYGHHPKEIQATLSAIKQEFINKKIVIIYHPDRPKRLLTFLDKYINVFKKADKTYVLPFLNMDQEKEQALNKIINNQNIFSYSTFSYSTKYKNHVFLFTGSKDMKKQIKMIISSL